MEPNLLSAIDKLEKQKEFFENTIFAIIDSAPEKERVLYGYISRKSSHQGQAEIRQLLEHLKNEAKRELQIFRKLEKVYCIPRAEKMFTAIKNASWNKDTTSLFQHYASIQEFLVTFSASQNTEQVRLAAQFLRVLRALTLEGFIAGDIQRNTPSE